MKYCKGKTLSAKMELSLVKGLSVLDLVQVNLI